MKKTILILITIIAALVFCIAGGSIGSDYSNVIACSITMLISFGWIVLLFYANSQ